MSGRTHARARPERTCVGCRERAAKDGLLRVARAEDACVPDPRGTLPGRGAYLHPAKACLDLAVRRRAFNRAFKAGGPLGTEALTAFLAEAAETP
ncbi:YlxR family protein [Streptomyces sp. NPDC051940]|uniref:YlxR family protein n=1 Tax=Streptomyces sp. NPDC051940 TaxID=3155675 RepID=UPI00342C7877